MVKRPRILILGDHAWRDIPGLASVRVELERILPDANVQIVDIHLFFDAVKLFHPHLVVMNHLHDRERNHIVDTVRRRGGLCVVLPTEGRPSSADSLRWAAEDFNADLCDLYLSWSETFAGYLPESVNRVVTGCPRFDFYHPPLRSLVRTKREMKSAYLLDERPIVTVASSFPSAKFARAGVEYAVSDWKKLGRTRFGLENPVGYIRREARAFDRFQAMILSLARERDYQIVVKPHPAENVEDWRLFCDSIGAHVMLTNYIWNLLAMSDLHVARLDCLTVPEAWIMGVPTLAVQVGENPYSGPGLESGDYTSTAYDVSTFLASVDLGLVSDLVAEDKGEYIAKWLGPMPDSSQRVAIAIARLLEERSPVTWKEPTHTDEAILFALLQEHSRQHARPRADAIGQFAKTVRWDAVQDWYFAVRRARENEHAKEIENP